MFPTALHFLHISIHLVKFTVVADILFESAHFFSALIGACLAACKEELTKIHFEVEPSLSTETICSSQVDSRNVVLYSIVRKSIGSVPTEFPD